jgi:hypothetical protein
MWEDVAVIHMIGTRPWNLNKDDIGWIGSQYEHSLSKAPIGYITNTWFTLLKNSPYKDKLNSMTVYNNLEFFHKNSLVQVKKNVFLQYKMIFTPKEGAVLDIKIMFANICIVHRIKEPVESGRSGKLYVCGIPLTEKILKLKL